MKEPATVSREMIQRHGLTEAEHARIGQLLGRAPTFTELGIFSVMWSEHCSYRSSRPLLQTLPTEGPQLLVRAGEENAGVVDIGDGWAVVFKVESHNHPSAVEPHAGAATGVGGILRDIFTMGARPIALLDSLRFGPLDDPRVRFLLDGVVRGIADYGNCMGVPTVGGEVAFDASYRDNPLVNVLCVGVVRRDGLVRAAAAGVGSPVYYLGSSTGRDGLGGAAFASRELTDASEEDRPAVQIGDPFAEKLLLEACLELIQAGCVAGIQDMGAAGLTCSTSEMAARAGAGIEIDVARVPRREAGMIPYEVMLSESQERMLMVVQPGKEREAEAIAARWGVHAVPVGRVTADGLVRVRENGRVCAEIPATTLTTEAPVYQRPVREPAYLARTRAWDPTQVPVPARPIEAFEHLLGSSTISSKAWIYEQYDHMVQTGTVVPPGAGDAAVLRLKRTQTLLAVTTDGNGTYTWLDPCEGGKHAVLEAARNLLCVGATPVAVTDCLNFGNPEDPEVFWQFAECVRGIAEACRALGTPVTGGNVSFYNDGPAGPVDPVPVIGMVGLVRGRPPITAGFKAAGHGVLVVGATREELGGSEYLKVVHGLKTGRPPRADLEEAVRLGRFLQAAAEAQWVQSAHDCAEGGLAIAIAESCVLGPGPGLGASVSLEPVLRDVGGAMRVDALLFGETASRVVLSALPDAVPHLRELGRVHHVPVYVIGRVGSERLRIDPWIDEPLRVLQTVWRRRLERRLTLPGAAGHPAAGGDGGHRGRSHERG